MTTNSNMICVLTYLVFTLTVNSDAQFVSPPASNSIKCTGDDINLPWSYIVSSNNASTVRWKKDGLTMLTWFFIPNNLVYEAGYSSSKIVHNGNADITITSLNDSDAGVYDCTVTYASTGTIVVSTTVTLVISCQEDDGRGLSDETKAGIGAGSAVGGGGCVAGVVAVIIIMIKGTVIKVYVKKGHDITFGESLDTSDVQWTKDGNKVESNLVVETRCKVERASEEHEGLYVCTSGKYKKKYRLVVLEEIVYINESLDTEFGEVSMTGAVWKKDERVVKSTPALWNKFKISNSSVKDEGLYVCILKSVKKQFKYYVIVVGTEEIIYVYQGFQTEFGKTIPDENTTKNAQWTQNSKNVGSDHSEHTKLIIDAAYLEHEGLYVCSFGDNHMHQLKYHLIVVGTDEVYSVNEGDALRFGKALPMKHAPSNTKWTHEGHDVETYKIKGTEIEIKKASKRDRGLYVLTFGPNNMQCRYTIFVLETKNANANEFSQKANESTDLDNENVKIKRLKKKKNKVENEQQSCAVVETVDETQHRSQNDKKLPPVEKSQNDKKLPPVENPTYLGSSPLDQKPFGAPLPTISKISQDNTDKST